LHQLATVMVRSGEGSRDGSLVGRRPSWVADASFDCMLMASIKA